MTDSKNISESIWHQFGASLKMLENAIEMCPEEMWESDSNFSYTAYHCIFWTDYFLTMQPNLFEPPKPFTLSEFDSNSKNTGVTYTKNELFSYLEHCQQKAYLLISKLTPEKLSDRWVNDYKNYSVLEILLYNLRHIQHHSAQLNLLLRQSIDNAPNWVDQAK